MGTFRELLSGLGRVHPSSCEAGGHGQTQALARLPHKRPGVQERASAAAECGRWPGLGVAEWLTITHAVGPVLRLLVVTAAAALCSAAGLRGCSTWCSGPDAGAPRGTRSSGRLGASIRMSAPTSSRTAAGAGRESRHSDTARGERGLQTPSLLQPAAR